MADLVTYDSVRNACVTLTSAEVKTLYSVGKTLIVAPGVGKYIFMHNAVATYNHGGLDYAFFTNCFCHYGHAGDTAGATCKPFQFRSANDFLGSSVSYVYPGEPGGDFNFLTDDIENQPMVFGKATGDYTDGNGTLVMNLFYSIIDIVPAT